MGNTPNITDWVQAIGVIIGMLFGIPAVILSFRKLFKQDKEREKEIKALKDISERQLEIIDEMRAQLKHDKNKRKADIRPFFISNGGSTSTNDWNLQLKNIGTNAKLLYIEKIKLDYLKLNENSVKEKIIEPNNMLVLRFKCSEVLRKIPFEFKIIFKDKDNNKYYQLICGDGMDYKVGDPVEIKE